MKKYFLTCITCLFAGISSAQLEEDTIVDVGNGHSLHFIIIKGKEAPILFESGFGDGSDVWKNITKQIADVTGATIITYDRLSYGGNIQNYYQIGIENEIKALEVGLQKLGYNNKSIMLVAHSLGGMYHSYYASRHSTETKAAVFIECPNICSLTCHFNLPETDSNDPVEKYLANLTDTVYKNPMPKNIPLLDIVSVGHLDDNGSLDTAWLKCHKEFVSQSATRKPLLAYGVGHAVHAENPQLVINAIITQYANYMLPKQKAILFETAYNQSLELLNEGKKQEIKCGQSEQDITTWGYSYLEKGENAKAIEIFKLYTVLYPEAWNAYDCLGEAYLKAGDKKLATENYKKSLELNPKNDNAVKILEKIGK